MRKPTLLGADQRGLLGCAAVFTLRSITRLRAVGGERQVQAQMFTHTGASKLHGTCEKDHRH